MTAVCIFLWSTVGHSTFPAMATTTGENETVQPVSIVAILCFANESEAERVSNNQRPMFALNPDGHGCGVIISSDGLIVTNRHFLGDPQTSRYQVWLRTSADSPPQRIDARVLAADSWSDLAVLKVDRGDLTPVRLADSDSLPARGDPVNLFADLSIVSGTGQPVSGTVGDPPMFAFFDEMNMSGQAGLSGDPVRKSVSPYHNLYQYGKLIRIETDQTGFTSGGAVLDSSGELVALTTALVPELQRTEAGSVASPIASHIAHIAIPVDDTFRHVVSCLEKGTLPGFGFLGVTPRDLSQAQQQGVIEGVQVIDVAASSPADFAGISFADVITHIDDRPVKTSRKLRSVIGGSPAGSTVRVSVVRGALNDDDPQENLEFEIVLSRQLLHTPRESFQVQPAWNWRGIQVDYPSAIENYDQLAHLVDRDGCVVITSVKIDSPAWKAGLRPRLLISQLEGRQVKSPDSFQGMTNQDAAGNVQLTVIDELTGQPMTIAVPPR